jgi:hypothetical protein
MDITKCKLHQDSERVKPLGEQSIFLFEEPKKNAAVTAIAI